MSAKTHYLSEGLLKLIFLGIEFVGFAMPEGATSLYVSLHTADPDASGTGDQTINEATYSGYARVSLLRADNPAGFHLSGTAQISPGSAVTFPTDTGVTDNLITHFGIGTAATGTGSLLYSGTVTPNITVTNGVTPQLTAATVITEA